MTRKNAFYQAHQIAAHDATMLTKSNKVTMAILLLTTFETKADITTIDVSNPNDADSFITSLSADGTVAVGQAEGHSVIYTPNGIISLGTFGGQYSHAAKISADGLVVAGAAYMPSGNNHAFKYTASGGLQNLGTLGGAYSDARQISADGSVILGISSLANDDRHAFKYTEATGMLDLGTLGGKQSDVSGISADGTVAIGTSTLSGEIAQHAYKYTDIGGMKDLGTLGGRHSIAQAISADGTVIVGNSNLSNTSLQAFKYTDAAGMVGLGTLPGGTVSQANAVSANGQVVVGGSNMANGNTHAYKHTDAGGMQDLGTIGGRESLAYVISADGTTVAGISETANGDYHAVKHTDADGMIDLGTLGGRYSSATSISEDGSVIAGYADTANNSRHATLWKNNIIVDSTNTHVALAQTAQQASQVIDLRSAQLQMLMQQDCSVGTGNGRFCIGVGAVYNSNRNARDTAASFTLGYQITPQWRIGTTINQSLDSSLPSEYKSSNNLPGIGVYSTFNVRKDRLGWQARVAAAYQTSKVDINRKRLSYTESGIGRADLDGKAASIEGSYRILASNDSIVAPYAALRYSNVYRSAYDETSGVEFVGRYAAMGRSATSIETGLRIAQHLNDKLNLSADIGVIRDIRVNDHDFAVAMDYVGGYSAGNRPDKRTRAHLGVQGNYAISKVSAIQGGVYWSQQPYGNSTTSAQLKVMRQF